MTNTLCKHSYVQMIFVVSATLWVVPLYLAVTFLGYVINQLVAALLISTLSTLSTLSTSTAQVGAVRVSRQLLQRRHGRAEVRLHAGGLPPANSRHHLLLRLPQPLV